jgi:hypothetical protein
MWEGALEAGSLVYLLYIIAPLIAALILWWIIVMAPGRRMAADIASLGTLKGRTLKEIIRTAGPPTSASTRTDGGQLLQWRARGYRIELLFDANRICQGEKHEASPVPSVTRNEPAPAKPRTANISETSQPITVDELRKSIAQQTAALKAPMDLRRPISSSAQNPPKESQITLCDSCGSSLTLGARFCDTCGNAVTRQVSPPRKEMIAPLGSRQRTMAIIESDVTVTELIQPVSISCESCGREIQGGDKFCDKCGSPIRLDYTLTP